MSQEFLDFLIALVIVIFAAKMGGYISTRFRQPSVLGELLVGLILGPTILNMLFSWPIFHEPELLEEALTLLAELGVILLMFLAGLELHLSELLGSGKVSALSGILGVLVPLGMGYGTAVLFGLESIEALFIALTLSATSVSISAQTLMELGVLRTRVGLGLLGSAVFDDILVILLLSVTFVLVSGGDSNGLGGVLTTVLGMVAYLAVAVLLGLFFLPRLAIWIERLPISQGIVAFTLVITLLFAWAAEVIVSMAAITGAFLVGLFLARTSFRAQIERGVATMAYGFFVPIFFVNIGLTVNMRDVGNQAVLFAVTITVVVVVSKIIGSGLGGLIGGFNINDLNKCPAVLEAWDAVKVPGITILESTGLGRMRKAGLRDNLPMMPSISELFRPREHHHRTIFAVVEGEEMVERLITATQEIVGDLNNPHTGVLFVLPVSRVVGFHGAKSRARGENSGQPVGDA